MRRVRFPLQALHLAQSHGEVGGVSLLELQQRLDALSAEQAVLLNQILGDMNNAEMNVRLKAIAEEKQDILNQMGALEQDEEQQSLREARKREMEEWLDRQPMCLTGYNDTLTRRLIEQITVVDAEAIRVKIRDTDVEIEQKMC